MTNTVYSSPNTLTERDFNFFCLRSIAEKGPGPEEKIASLEAVVSNYEAKVSGLEHEMETQKEEYEKKLVDFAARSESF